MPSTVINDAVESCLRELLVQDGFQLSPLRAHGETGVDIVATKFGEAWHIEVIGYKSSGPARAKDFFEGFFRALSRLNDGAKHCVVALADQAQIGLPARARQHRVAWERIAKAFPELEIWLVDVEGRRYEKTTWAEWRR